VQPFVSTVINKLDAKSRVSVPAPFRQILAAQNLRGLYCIPAFSAPTLEAFGETLIEKVQVRLAGLDPLFDSDYDVQAMAVLGQAQLLHFDEDGRVRLPDDLLAYAGLTGRVAFVGLGDKFQIWDPERLETVRRDSVEKARALRAAKGAA
jgi:MraZ protein